MTDKERCGDCAHCITLEDSFGWCSKDHCIVRLDYVPKQPEDNMRGYHCKFAPRIEPEDLEKVLEWARSKSCNEQFGNDGMEHEWDEWLWLETAEEAIRRAYDAGSRQKTTEWIFFQEECGNPIDGVDYNWGWKCRECGEYADKMGWSGTDDPDIKPGWKACPDCGCKVEGEGE